MAVELDEGLKILVAFPDIIYSDQDKSCSMISQKS